MIAVSSMRPVGIHEQIDANQMAAYQSWRSAFSFIVYFNNPQEGFEADRTAFFPSEAFPRIKDLAAFCSIQDEWCCIINADIVVGQQFPAVERRLAQKQAFCATSRRYEFDPAIGPSGGAAVVDNGMDIFCAIPSVWKEMSKVIPDQFRIGHDLWDTWVLGFFELTGKGAHYDFTPSRCIFHPKHQFRTRVHSIDPSKPDKYLRAANWPNRKIAV